MNTSPHLTTRRGFVASMGFGGISLYGLWVGYDAVPGPSALFRPVSIPGAPTANGRGGHDEHGIAPSGLDVGAFRGEVADFIARFAKPDGSVKPQPDFMPAMDMAGMKMTPDEAAPSIDHEHHGPQGSDPAATALGDHAGPVAVPMLAERWFYEPSHLLLEAGTTYRFRLLATDIPHGASIQFGHGARMIRLRPGRVTEVDLTFTRPGRYLVYCTAYCGAGHDAMQARIDVA